MSEHRITLTWPGGEHEFALALGQLRALQLKCDAGPEEILDRVLSGRWRVDDLIHIHRLGLIGGGMEGAAAATLVESLFETGRVLRFRSTAIAILSAALIGVPDDQPGGDNAPGEATGAPGDAPENGGSPTSTVPAA